VTAARLRTTPLAWVYLVAGLAATGLYFALPWNRMDQWLLYELISGSSAVAVLVGTRRHRRPVAAAWYLFAAGLVAFAAGDPSMRDLSKPSPASGPHLGRVRLLVLWIAVATVPSSWSWNA